SSPACENRAVGDLSGHAPHGSPERPSGIREPTAPARETPVPPDDRTVLPRPPPTGRGPRTGAGPLIADEGSAHPRHPGLQAPSPPLPPRPPPPPPAPWPRRALSLAPAPRPPLLIVEASTGRAPLTRTGQRSWTGRYLHDQRLPGAARRWFNEVAL